MKDQKFLSANISVFSWDHFQSITKNVYALFAVLVKKGFYAES